jgi:hypothetical protein
MGLIPWAAGGAVSVAASDGRDLSTCRQVIACSGERAGHRCGRLISQQRLDGNPLFSLGPPLSNTLKRLRIKKAGRSEVNDIESFS